MKRKEFVKCIGFACMCNMGISSIFIKCTSASHFAHHIIENDNIIINKNEFINYNENIKSERKYIIIRNEKLEFPICIFKIYDDKYTAVSMECTHSSCELQNTGEYLICPCHGSEFNNNGEVLSPPAEENLKKYKITIENEKIYVKI